MQTLTRGEITIILRMVEERRDEGMCMRDVPNQQYSALWNLEYENMGRLAEKLHEALVTGAKRIAIHN